MATTIEQDHQHAPSSSTSPHDFDENTRVVDGASLTSPSTTQVRPNKRARIKASTSTGNGTGREKREKCAIACNRCKAKKLKCFRAESETAETNPSTQCAACAKAEERCVFDDSASRSVNVKYLQALEARCAQLEKTLADINPRHAETNDHYVPPTSQTQVQDVPIASGSTPQANTLATVEEYSDRRATQQKTSFSFNELFKAPARRRPHPTDLGAVMQPSVTSDPAINPNPSLLPVQVAQTLIDTAYEHVQSRYPFLDWEQIHAWHADRDRLCDANASTAASTADRIGAFFLWAIYAVGVELLPISGVESADSYFDRAWKNLDAVMIPYDLTTIRAFLLATFYTFRAPAGPSLWLLAGFAMRICIEMGLHRKSPTSCDPLEDQLRKRVFWSAYAFDRLVSHASGRPVSVPDSSIDLDFPINIDTSLTDLDVISARLASSPSMTANTELTNMTSAIHSIKLYHIRSRVHEALAAAAGRMPTKEVTVGLLAQLEAWKRTIPRPQQGCKVPLQPVTRFEWRYFHIVLLTLRSTILTASASDPTLNLCAAAAAEALELDRTVHDGPLSRQTSVSVCHTFICGAMLLYCLQICPTVIPRRASSRAIRACSGTLAIYSQLFHDTLPFYELFEHMADEILSEPTFGSGNEDSRNQTVNTIAAMLKGNYEYLAVLYDTLKSRKTPGPQSELVQTIAAAPAVMIPPPTTETTYPNSFPYLVDQSTGLTPYFTNPTLTPTLNANGSGSGGGSDLGIIDPFAEIQTAFQIPFGGSGFNWETLSGGPW